MRRHVGGALMAVVALIALSACRVGTKVVVQPDGSGTYALILTAPPGNGGDPGPAIVSQLKKAAEQSEVPLTVEPYQGDGESGAKASFAFASLPDLKAESARIAAAGSGLSAVTVDKTTTGWTFGSEGAANGAGPVPATGFASTGSNIDGSQLTGVVQVSVVVTLPGAPAANNATSVTHDESTSTFTWAVPINQSTKPLSATTTFVADQQSVALATNLTALRDVSTSGCAGGGQTASGSQGSGGSAGSSSHAVGIGLAVGALVLLGAGGAVMVRRKRADPAD